MMLKLIKAADRRIGKKKLIDWSLKIKSLMMYEILIRRFKL